MREGGFVTVIALAALGPLLGWGALLWFRCGLRRLLEPGHRFEHLIEGLDGFDVHGDFMGCELFGDDGLRQIARLGAARGTRIRRCLRWQGRFADGFGRLGGAAAAAEDRTLSCDLGRSRREAVLSPPNRVGGRVQAGCQGTLTKDHTHYDRRIGGPGGGLSILG